MRSEEEICVREFAGLMFQVGEIKEGKKSAYAKLIFLLKPSTWGLFWREFLICVKIDVVCLTKRANYDGPLTVSYETIRVPSSVKILNRKTVEKILRERVRRIRRLREYWKGKITENQNPPFIDDHSDRVLISWSPIITTDALNFICDNF